MTTSEALPLADVLSVTTGSLVSRDHIGGVYRVCDYMTGVANFTHQLPRVADEIKPVIFAQHPWLESIEAPDWNFADEDSAPVRMAVIETWLSTLEAQYGATVALVPLADYKPVNPIEELCDMVGPEKVFVLDPDAGEDA